MDDYLNQPSFIIKLVTANSKLMLLMMFLLVVDSQ